MSLLALQLPNRLRPGPRTPAAEGHALPEVQAQWAYVFSADGQSAGPLRFAPTAALPKADQVVLVLAAADVSWHRARLPKAPAARMRLALLGTLEEQLLEEEDAVHLALAAGASPGHEGWVAAAHAPHLKAALAALEAAGVQVARVASALPPPGGGLRAHFSTQDLATALPWQGLADDHGRVPEEGWAAASAATAAQAADDGTYLTLCTPTGAWHLPLPASGGAPPGPGTQLSGATSGPVISQPTDKPAFKPGSKPAFIPSGKPVHKRTSPGSDLASALRNSLPDAAPADRWTCTPAAAEAAERFMGRPVPVLSPAAYLLECALSATNLRQFELQPRHRGLAALRGVRQQLARREWRTVRTGLWAFAALQLAGLNAVAWSQQQALQVRRLHIDGLLRSTFPNERTVLDAPAQMRAQTQKLRSAAGQPSPGDLEPALAAAASAWPEGKPAVAAIRYEAGRLTLASAGWQEAELAALRQRLHAQGWTVAYTDTLLALQHRAAPP